MDTDTPDVSPVGTAAAGAAAGAAAAPATAPASDRGAAPAVVDEGWRAQLKEAVDDLDELERPFTDYDRQRWGGVSRDSHITSVRARFLEGQ